MPVVSMDCILITRDNPALFCHFRPHASTCGLLELSLEGRAPDLRCDHHRRSTDQDAGQTYEVEAAAPLFDTFIRVLLVGDKGFDAD